MPIDQRVTVGLGNTSPETKEAFTRVNITKSNPIDTTKVFTVKAVPPPVSWWILALVGGLGGIIIIGGIVYYEEERKKVILGV